MKKPYIKSEIIDRSQLLVNQAVAGCSVESDHNWQYWPDRDQVDGYTVAELRGKLEIEDTQWDPADYNQWGAVCCPCYNVSITFPAGTNSENPSQTSVSFFYEDWDWEGDLDDWRTSNFADESDNYSYGKSQGWSIATASQQGDFVESLIGANLGRSLTAVNS